MCWAGCRWNWWGANNAKCISNEATAITRQFAESRWRCEDGAWVDFWGYHSKATEAAYQSGAKWFQFQTNFDHDVTVVFGPGGYGDEHYQYSGNGTYRRVRRVKILMQ